MVVTIGNRETENFGTEGSQGVHRNLSLSLRHQLHSTIFFSKCVSNAFYVYSLPSEGRKRLLLIIVKKIAL